MCDFCRYENPIVRSYKLGDGTYKMCKQCDDGIIIKRLYAHVFRYNGVVNISFDNRKSDHDLKRYHPEHGYDKKCEKIYYFGPVKDVKDWWGLNQDRSLIGDDIPIESEEKVPTSEKKKTFGDFPLDQLIKDQELMSLLNYQYSTLHVLFKDTEFNNYSFERNPGISFLKDLHGSEMILEDFFQKSREFVPSITAVCNNLRKKYSN